MLDKLMGNPIAWCFLSLCTVISMIWGIYIGIKGIKRKTVSTLCRSYKVIQQGEKGIAGLNVQYRNENISDLTISMYGIWNSGNETIRSDDMVSVDSLRITSSDEKTNILNASVIKVSDDSNLFEIEKVEDESVVKIHFDYAEPKQGAVIQVMHTGDEKNLIIQGKIKGGSIKQFTYNKNEIVNRKMKNIFLVSMMVTEMLLLPILTVILYLEAFGIIEMSARAVPSTTFNVENVFALGLMTMLSLATDIVFYKEIVRKLYLQIPKNLRDYIEYE